MIDKAIKKKRKCKSENSVIGALDSVGMRNERRLSVLLHNFNFLGGEITYWVL